MTLKIILNTKDNLELKKLNLKEKKLKENRYKKRHNYRTTSARKERASSPVKLMNLPNKLTMLRIISVPAFIVVYLMGYNIAATIIFVLASATDALDGHIARKKGLVTNFGKIMDPLADKILVLAAFVCMVQLGVVPGWMVIVVLFREFLVSGLRMVAAAEGTVIAAAPSGKIKTITQMIAIPLLLLNNWPCSYIGFPLDQVFLWISVVMTIVSGVEYIYKNRKVLLKGGI